jgi:cytochrome oxidase Cu insertion factor (SCO1/SenC/PrrC family)
MGGMGGARASASSFIIAQFHHYLALGACVVIAVAFVLTVIYTLVGHHDDVARTELPARTWLRAAFGALWILDGLLQLQAGMPLGLANQVMSPTASGNPHFVGIVVQWAVRTWNAHPLALAPATVWIQVGIGLLLWCSRGRASQLAGAVSVLWGFAIWSGGNGFGGIFTTTGSFLFGWPGAIVFYMIAGVVIAAPPTWSAEKIRRVTTRSSAAILVVGSVWQALPANHFWSSGDTNSLYLMSQNMSAVPQPSSVRSLVSAVGRSGFHGGLVVNAVVVAWMLTTAIGLWKVANRPIVWPVVSAVVGAVAVWVGVQDLGFFGGVGTDPNSMLPFAALTLGAYSWQTSPRLSSPRWTRMGASVGAFATAMLFVGALPAADAVIVAPVEATQYQALNADVSVLNPRISAPALAVAVRDQNNRPATVIALGQTTVLTFLDPTCWTDCAALGRQLISLDARLGHPRDVRYVAVCANRFHHSVADLRSFIARYGLGTLGSRFEFVTGSLRDLETVWSSYGIEVDMKPTDRMSVHTDQVDVADRRGNIAVIVPDDPPGGWAGQESAVTVLANAVHVAQQ